MPTIHPVLDAGTPCAGHTVEMAAAVAPGGDRCVLDGAKVLAMTVIDHRTDPELREQERVAWEAVAR